MNTLSRKLIAILVALLAATAATIVVWKPWRSEAPKSMHPLPPYSQSAFLNTGLDAQYVGIDACKECHDANHDSYLMTAHSRAFADVNAKTEPPDGSFEHKATGRSYRVYRLDGQLRHEEVRRNAQGDEIARVDLPVKYRMGSGHFSRTYVVEVDGFLHESPITYYESKKNWDLSPGYDQTRQSFERPIRLGCVHCHVGRAEPEGEAAHRMTIREQPIGCERCHGPGSLHVEFHRANKPSTGPDDFTIVNPAKLPRAQRESICADCHLSTAASVYLRGRMLGDFRPGRPLFDYRADYRFESDNEQMTVTGHMEQLRQSACYKKSGDLTCVTCHEPHIKEKPKDPTIYYRDRCLSCHDTRPCKLPKPERIKKDANDSCAVCHMPRGDTDIPHLAFTHHRIGLHTGKPKPPPERLAALAPVDDVSRVSAVRRAAVDRRDGGVARAVTSVNFYESGKP